MAYATRTQLKENLGITGTADDNILDRALAYAQAFIDAHTGRTFEAVTETRYFDRSALDMTDRRRLLLDKDLLTITTLKNGDDDATTIGSTHYRLEPRGTTHKDSIRLLDASDFVWEWGEDGAIEVAGTWGYSTTADALIQNCCLRLAEYWYRSKSLVDVTTAFDETPAAKIKVSFPNEVLVSLAPYVRLA